MNQKKYSSTSQKLGADSKNKQQKSQTNFQNNSDKSELTKNYGHWGYDGQQQNGSSAKYVKSSEFTASEIFAVDSATPLLRYSKTSSSKPTIIIRELQVGVDPKTNEPLKVLAADDPSTGARLVYGHPSMSSLGHQQENKSNSVITVQAVSVIISPDSNRLEVQEVHPETYSSFSNFLDKEQPDNEKPDISDLPSSEAENICKCIVSDAVTDATSSEVNSKYSYKKSGQTEQQNLADTRYSIGRNSKDVPLTYDQEEELCRGIFEDTITVSTSSEFNSKYSNKKTGQTQQQNLADTRYSTGRNSKLSHEEEEELCRSIFEDTITVSIDMSNRTFLQGYPWRDSDELPFQSDGNLPPVDPKNECEVCDVWPPRKKRKKPSVPKVEKPKKQCVTWGKCQQQYDKKQNPEWQFFLATFFKFRGKEPLREVLKKEDVNATQDLDPIPFTEPIQVAHTAKNLNEMKFPKNMNPETRSGNHKAIQENENRLRMSTERCQSNIEQEEREAQSRHNSTAPSDSSSRRSERSLVRGVARKYKRFIQAVLKRKRR